jgi:hypothetical protein
VNAEAPFFASDMEEIDARLYSRAAAVVSMRDIHNGNRDPAVIGLRHDVDDNHGSLDTALAMAEWEHERDYQSTYFLLHDSYYWPHVRDAARELVGFGHEVGLHVNAIGEAIRQGGRDPHAIMFDALHELRCAVPDVTGMVAHGDQLCHEHGFVNDELFMECRRPSYGAAARTVGGVAFEPRSMWDYGIKYDASWLSRAEYLSDSGGRWSRSFDEVADGFPFRAGQLHMLVHPDWWAEALRPGSRERVAA